MDRRPSCSITRPLGNIIKKSYSDLKYAISVLEYDRSFVLDIEGAILYKHPIDLIERLKKKEFNVWAVILLINRKHGVMGCFYGNQKHILVKLNLRRHFLLQTFLDFYSSSNTIPTICYTLKATAQAHSPTGVNRYL